MEVFGLIFAAGLGLFVSPIYCLLVAKLLRRSARLSAIAFYGAITILALLVGTLALTILLGVTATHEGMGPAFNIVRGFCLLMAAPALGAVLLLGKRTPWWPLTAGLCWLVGFSAILFGIYVSETLYGVDGQGPTAFESTDAKSK
jgi:hypothetical protein